MPARCKGLPCHVVTYKTSDFLIESLYYTWLNRFVRLLKADSRVLLQGNDEVMQLLQKEASVWNRVDTEGCEERCYCVASKDPKDIVHSTTRMPFKAKYTAADGKVLEMNGSYELDIERAAGTCVPIPDETWYAIQLLKWFSQGGEGEPPSPPSEEGQ